MSTLPFKSKGAWQEANDALNQLQLIPIERRVIALRAGLNTRGDSGQSLEEVGQTLGLPIDEVQQIEGRVLSQLAQHDTRLAEYLEDSILLGQGTF